MHAWNAQPEIESTHPIANTRTKDHDASGVGETICGRRKANSLHSTHVISEPVLHRANLNNTNDQTKASQKEFKTPRLEINTTTRTDVKASKAISTD